VFTDGDRSLAEINPLAVTTDGKVLALDAKVVLDDNADFRHKDWEGWRDPAEETWRPARAREGPVVRKLDGDIGCTSTAPACDGDDGPDQALRRRTRELPRHRRLVEPERSPRRSRSSPPNRSVRAILFNIFGGITRCDDVANGMSPRSRPRRSACRS
jgi:succinyl-CoA synthetase beta subunit